MYKIQQYLVEKSDSNKGIGVRDLIPILFKTSVIIKSSESMIHSEKLFFLIGFKTLKFGDAGVVIVEFCLVIYIYILKHNDYLILWRQI